VSLEIHGVRALKDNYVWLVVDRDRREAAAVDPSEATVVVRALAKLGVRLSEIWNTHHHWDHTAGNRELIDKLGVQAVRASAYDGEQGRIPGQTMRLADGDVFDFAAHRVRVMAIPAHTLGHVAYHVEDAVFPGDTLFGAGCGRLFEGTPEQMFTALGRLRELPDKTWVYCGHEYTLHNLKFAAEVMPGDQAVRDRLVRVAAQSSAWTVPLDLGEEKRTNPFLRAGDVSTLAGLRRRKDLWRES
jgi:hydroxyacylglutathione hydrolase